MKSNRLTYVFVLSTLLGVFGLLERAHAADEPQFNCATKQITIYSPGPRWSSLEQELSGHLAYIADQMKAGNIELGGPLVTDQNVPNGGLVIYSIADLAKVRQIAESDPLIQHQVANFERRTWQMCGLAK